MEAGIVSISDGSVTSPRGFTAGATYAGIKQPTPGVLDLGILFSEVPCVAAGVFTTNRIKAAPVLLAQQRLQTGQTRAIVVNSGVANACTGESGLDDAGEMGNIAAGCIGVAPDEVLVASTGVIGQPLPLDLIKAATGRIRLSTEGGHELARAIMTTDTVPKKAAVTVPAGGNEFVIGGIAKGSGMIHPNLATLLCFITTDAAVEVDFLRQVLLAVMDVSFNMVSIDGDTSPNDMVLLLANGQAGNAPITRDSPLADVFHRALAQVCIQLAKGIARDGEGASRLIEVSVAGAASRPEARLVARTVVGSSLVKAAVHGGDPNWGRIIAAAGRSGAAIDEAKVGLFIGDTCIFRDGCRQPFNEAVVAAMLRGSEVLISLRLNLGEDTATAWGCDLSAEYVTINSEYRT